MIYQIFSNYYQFSLDKKVKPLLCRIDPEHGILVPNMRANDEIYLYCVECTYELLPGLNLYNKLKEAVTMLKMGQKRGIEKR